MTHVLEQKILLRGDMILTFYGMLGWTLISILLITHDKILCYLRPQEYQYYKYSQRWIPEMSCNSRTFDLEKNIDMLGEVY